MTPHPPVPDEQGLVNTIRQLSSPLEQENTNTASQINPLQGVRAVLFDVYGTLFLSGSGDIGVTCKTGIPSAFQEALAAVQLRLPVAHMTRAHNRFYELIEESHALSRSEGISHPEVDIVSIWRTLVQQLAEGEALDKPLSHAGIYRLAVEYECRQNPVWPMPGLRSVLASLHDDGLFLGIVSNAQFYTPLLFPALLKSSLEDMGIEQELCAWSWILKQAKPSARLMESVLETLNLRGIMPAEVVVVGNDMLNDIQMADAAGCQTILFAGDRRSLRLREDHPACETVTPHAVITNLSELPGCLGSKT